MIAARLRPGAPGFEQQRRAAFVAARTAILLRTPGGQAAWAARYGDTFTARGIWASAELDARRHTTPQQLTSE